MRLFIATALPSAIVTAARDLRERLDPEADSARWARPESIHLTLKFLGEVDPSRLDTIDRELARIRRAPFNVVVSGVGFFPSQRSPRVFWLGIRSDGLRQLAEDVEARMAEAGFSPETRGFSPHLTLARAARNGRIAGRLVEAAQQLEDTVFGTFDVDRYHLYQSQLRRSGAVYTQLHSYLLRPSGGSGRRNP